MRHLLRTAINAFVRVSITSSVWTRKKETDRKSCGERIGGKGVEKLNGRRRLHSTAHSNENEANTSLGMIAPHSGQSSQLSPETTDRNAQFLSTAARNALVRQGIHVSHSGGNPIPIPHSGQSSQLPFDSNARNARFLSIVSRP